MTDTRDVRISELEHALRKAESQRDALRAEVSGIRVEYEAAIRVIVEQDRYRHALDMIRSSCEGRAVNMAERALTREK